MVLVLISSQWPLLMGTTFHHRSLILLSRTNAPLFVPKGVNKDNSLFPCCTWFHLQKVNYHYKKKQNIFFPHVHPKAAWITLYSFLFSVVNTVPRRETRSRWLVENAWFSPCEVKAWNLKKTPTVHLLCRRTISTPRLRGNWGGSKGLSAEVSQSAAAGLCG